MQVVKNFVLYRLFLWSGPWNGIVTVSGKLNEAENSFMKNVRERWRSEIDLVMGHTGLKTIAQRQQRSSPNTTELTVIHSHISELHQGQRSLIQIVNRLGQSSQWRQTIQDSIIFAVKFDSVLMFVVKLNLLSWVIRPPFANPSWLCE